MSGGVCGIGYAGVFRQFLIENTTRFWYTMVIGEAYLFYIRNEIEVECYCNQ